MQPLTRSAWTWAAATLALQAILAAALSFDGLYGQDAYAYVSDAGHLRTWLGGGPPPPPFFWTRGYSLAAALLPLPLPLAGQALSMLAHALTVAVMHRWATRRHGPSALSGPLLMLALGLSPYLLRSGLSAMSDSWAIFWASAALWQAWEYRQTGQLRHWIAFLLAAGAATAVRYAVGPLLLVPGLACLLPRPRAAALLLAPVALLPLVPELLLMPGGPSSATHSFGIAWSPIHLLQRQFTNTEGAFTFSLPNILQVLKPLWHPGLLGTALVAWLALPLWRRLQLPRIGREGWTDIATLGLYALFLGGIPFQNDRFLLPMLPLSALAALPALLALAQRPKPGLRSAALALLLLGQALLCLRALQPMRHNSLSDRQIVADLDAQRPGPPKRVYTLSSLAMLQWRRPALDLHGLHTPAIAPPRAGDLVLADLAHTLPQWQDMPPARHWRSLQARFHLDSLRAYPFHNVLYVLR